MADTKQLLFSGLGAAPPRAAEFKKPEPGDRPAWFEILEAAFFKLTSTDEGKQLYGDPVKGATVEQAWQTNGVLTGKWPVCLISTGQPSVATGAIERVIKMTSEAVVDVLVELFGMSERMAAPTLYHDGHMGHAITLLEYDKDARRFIYHDPWPGDSLLCRDFNAAGVDARPKDGYWSVTDAELEKVIFAAFVPRLLWSEYTGEKYHVTYEELKTSDFWSRFRLREVGREGPDERGRTLVTLKTGGFQSELDLSVALDRQNRLSEGTLNLKRSWVTGPPYGLNPHALDIERNFVAALVPPPDRDAVSPLLGVLRQLKNPAYGEQLINEGPDKSIWHRALFTYLGPSPSFTAPFQLSNLSMQNVARDGADWLQTVIKTDTL